LPRHDLPGADFGAAKAGRRVCSDRDGDRTGAPWRLPPSLDGGVPRHPAHLQLGSVRDRDLAKKPPGAKLRAVPVPADRRRRGQIVNVPGLNGRDQPGRKKCRPRLFGPCNLLGCRGLRCEREGRPHRSGGPTYCRFRSHYPSDLGRIGHRADRVVDLGTITGNKTLPVYTPSCVNGAWAPRWDTRDACVTALDFADCAAVAGSFRIVNMTLFR